MAQPSSALTRWDASLNTNEFDLEMNRRGLSARASCDRASSALSRRPTARFRLRNCYARKIPRESPAIGYGRDTFEVGNTSYATSEYGWECPLDDRENAFIATWWTKSR